MWFIPGDVFQSSDISEAGVLIVATVMSVWSVEREFVFFVAMGAVKQTVHVDLTFWL